MNVIVISECTKKARVKTRRIVSQYLPQCGSQVWMGSISDEGLQELRKELQRHASRNMSVICHVITSRVTQKVAFVVGSRKNFDEHGHFVFSCTKQKLPEEISKREILIFLSEIGRLAGLLHDLGKNIVSFQYKIRGLSASMADPARHERLSAHVCCLLLREYLQSCASEDKVLEQAAAFTFEEWDQLIKKGLRQIEDSIRTRRTSPDSADELINRCLHPPGRGARQKERESFPVFAVLIQLILSHHFLPYTETSEKGEKAKILEKRYIHGYSESSPCDAMEVYGNPSWHHQGWLDRVQETVKSVLELKTKIKLPEISTLLLYSFFVARPALVAADQIVSAEGSRVKYKGNPDGVCFANPYDIGKGEMAQTLSRHLIDVGRRTARNMEWLDLVWQGHRLDYAGRIPSQLRAKKDLPTAFAWQARAQEVAQKLHSRQKETKNLSGFFGVMAAATGTGKTRCIPRFMSHLQGEGKIRFTLALGLRTLTEQSGKNYVNSEEIGFEPNKEVSVLIGGEFRDYSREKEGIEYQPDSAGYTCKDEDRLLSELTDHLYGDTYIDVDSPFPADLAGPRGELSWSRSNDKLAKMLQVPILVCTIDHLMAGLVSPRADASKRLIRILTSDLVIDEIDSFAIEDLRGLARLIFLTGAAGRRVLLSSATVSPVLSRYLFQAYLRGYEQYCRVTPDTPALVHFAWLTHTPELCGFEAFSLDRGAEEAVKACHQKYSEACRNMLVRLKTQPVRRKLKYLDLSDCRVMDGKGPAPGEVYEEIAARVSREIDRLHDCFRVENSGRFLSVGLVRFSQARHAFQVFNRLVEEPDRESTKRVYVFYQARLTDVNLERLEEVLNRMLSRRHGPEEPDPVWSAPEIENLIRFCPEKTSFQVVIVSTPIEEVGRDHDFDYAIIEPTSIWSTVQTAGRVARHRLQRILEDGDPANVVMFSHPLRELFFSGSTGLSPYSGPGPVKKGCGLSSYDAREIFPPEMSGAVDARFALKERTVDALKEKYDSIGDLETSRVINDIGGVCEERENDPLLGNWLTHASSYFDSKYPFRSSSGIDVEVEFTEEGTRCRYLDRREQSIRLSELDFSHCRDRFLLNYSSSGYERSGRFVIQAYGRKHLEEILLLEGRKSKIIYSDETGGIVL